MKKKVALVIVLAVPILLFVGWYLNYSAPATKVFYRYEKALEEYSVNLRKSEAENEYGEILRAREDAYKKFMDEIDNIVIGKNGAITLIGETYKKYASYYISRANLPQYFFYYKDPEDWKEVDPEIYRTIEKEILIAKEEGYFCIPLATDLKAGEKTFEEYTKPIRYYYFKKTFWGYKLDWIKTMQDLLIKRQWITGMDFV